jgi:BirA family biotin operon repressor/biotin-[acetyl-CoA-carboxylase] ligase
MAAACAVAEAAARLVPAERFDVKWPNDVLHGRRKLSGVLAETRVPDSSAVPPIVVGFGVNVNQRDGDWPEEIRPIATSLRVAAGDRAFDPALVLREVLDRYDRYVALAAAGDADGLWDAVRSRLPAAGTPLVVVSSERRVEGTVDGYEPTGALRLRDASGTVHTLAAGEIPLDPGTSGGART